MTLREYVLRWQEAYDKPQSRPTTYAAHGYIFKNHIVPGDRNPSQIPVGGYRIGCGTCSFPGNGG